MFTDNTPMPFGRYKGKPLIDVPGVYLLWLHNEGVTHPELKAYILNNLELIKKEAAKAKRK